MGVTGTISAANSLVGTSPDSQVTPLSNSNYVVSSANAATWGNSGTGISGTISAANSLLGTGSNFQVTPLSGQGEFWGGGTRQRNGQK
jgi:hypothetical protein